MSSSLSTILIFYLYFLFHIDPKAFLLTKVKNLLNITSVEIKTIRKNFSEHLRESLNENEIYVSGRLGQLFRDINLVFRDVNFAVEKSHRGISELKGIDRNVRQEMKVPFEELIVKIDALYEKINNKNRNQ